MGDVRQEASKIRSEAARKALRARNRKVTQITTNLHKVIVGLVTHPVTLWDLEILLSLSEIMVKLSEGEEGGKPTSRSSS